MGSPIAKNRGFTLVELAIVLVIVGILLGAGTGMVSILTKAIKVRESRDLLDAATQSITSWASANNRIPDNGATTSTFPSVVKSPSDSWGQNIYYVYDSVFAPGAPTKDTICGRRTSLITIQDKNNPGTSIQNVVFAVVSPGDNSVLDTTFSPAPTWGAAPLSSSGAVTAATTITMDTYNDIVRWVTLDELRSKAGCQGAPLRIVNNELPYGSASSPTYKATISADGGVPNAAPDSYSWCIQTTPANAAPAGLTFQKPDATGAPVAIPNVTNLFQTNCSTYGVANWIPAGQLMISGTPSGSGSYYFTVYVADTNSNVASKPFVFTANP